jgi:hypothetical protein
MLVKIKLIKCLILPIKLTNQLYIKEGSRGNSIDDAIKLFCRKEMYDVDRKDLK